MLALLGLVCLLSQLVPLQSKIHHSVVDTDDRKLVPLTEAFGFSSKGHVSSDP